MKSRITHVEFPVFCGYICHIEVTSDLKKSLLKYPETKKVAEEEEVTSDAKALTVHAVNEAFSFIFLPHNASVGDIAHESWHVVKHMMEHVGVKLDSETVAYHLGFLVNKVFCFLRRRK
jgi:hypothetical protein